jgi:hypothetical protein
MIEFNLDFAAIVIYSILGSSSFWRTQTRSYDSAHAFL